MKSFQIAKLIKGYRPLFRGNWRFNRREFVRRSSHWVQVVSLNVSRNRDEYIPRTACDFLLLPGPVTGGWLCQELLTRRHSVQWWVTLKEHESNIDELMDMMNQQFFPQLQKEIDEDLIEEKLAQDLSYWPNPYALCVMSYLYQNLENAETYYKAYLEAVSDKPYPWATERKKELDNIHQLSYERDKLHEHLTHIEAQRLSQFKAFR
jgi:hypothetical protein